VGDNDIVQWRPEAVAIRRLCGAETRPMIPLASTSPCKNVIVSHDVIVSRDVAGAEIDEMESGRAPPSLQPYVASVAEAGFDDLRQYARIKTVDNRHCLVTVACVECESPPGMVQSRLHQIIISGVSR
ncbi:hypothetical protein LSAT2_024014, partial [Lamellibrachia satsuma]